MKESQSELQTFSGHFYWYEGESEMGKLSLGTNLQA